MQKRNNEIKMQKQTLIYKISRTRNFVVEKIKLLGKKFVLFPTMISLLRNTNLIHMILFQDSFHWFFQNKIRGPKRSLKGAPWGIRLPSDRESILHNFFQIHKKPTMADFDDEKAPKKARIAIPLRIRLAEGLIAKASQGKAEKSKSEVLTERFRLLQRSNPASILFVPSSSSSLSSESSSSLSSQSLPSNSLPSILQSFSFPDDIHTGPLISMPMIDKARIRRHRFSTFWIFRI